MKALCRFCEGKLEKEGKVEIPPIWGNFSNDVCSNCGSEQICDHLPQEFFAAIQKAEQG